MDPCAEVRWRSLCLSCMALMVRGVHRSQRRRIVLCGIGMCIRTHEISQMQTFAICRIRRRARRAPQILGGSLYRDLLFVV